MCLNVKVKAYTLPLSILFSLQVILFLNVDVLGNFVAYGVLENCL